MSAPQRIRAWGAGVAAGHLVLGALATVVLQIHGAEMFFGLCALATYVLSRLAAPLLRPRGDDDGPGGGGPPPRDDEPPPWWPRFERELRAHIEDRERARSG